MIALLPMKAHSERVPNKNIKLLNGKPLFFYIADTLKATNFLELLAINTDSQEIARLAAERYGDWVQVIKRPSQICGDNVSMNTIIAHDIEVLGLENDYFQTHSTSPLLSVETVSSAINQYMSEKATLGIESVFSVNALHTRLYSKDLSPLNHDPRFLIRTQDLDVIYEENSSFYIFSGSSFFSNNHRIGVSSSPYIMNRNSTEVIDIDEPQDWDLAEIIMKAKEKI
jgi:CMP-N-acetylneuraminic acid synthetase